MLLQPAIRAAEAARALPGDAVARLSRLYPSQSGILAHRLADHPLFTLEALARASECMNPAHVECRAANNGHGQGFAFAAPPAGDVADAIRGIGTADRWIMLRFAEQVPEYAALLDDILMQVEPVVAARTGVPLRAQAFIFISSPGSVTPFHFDPEYNLFFQIAGRKRFAVYPPDTPWLTDEANERFHRAGDNLLPWRDEWRGQGTVHALGPGGALFVPYKSPHWVEVDEGPSISLQVTWRSHAGFQQDDAYLFNAWLRRFGLAPSSPRPLLLGSPLKSAAWRIVRRLKLDRTA